MSSSLARKRILGLLLLVGLVTVALGINRAFTPLVLPQRTPSEARDVVLEVKPGWTAREIGYALFEEGLIESPLVFRLFARLKGVEGRLRAGEFQIRSDWGLPEILEHLLKGPVLTHAFTVPEGYTVVQIAELLEQKGFGEAARFLKAARELGLNLEVSPETADLCEPMEGYLFPDTYMVARNTPEEEIVRLMYRRFLEVFSEPLRERAQEVGLSVHQTVVLASIIEKEAQMPQERPIISSVFHNRLRIGMKLDADPTVLYVLGRVSGPLYLTELDVDSPYNTYRYAGLPPGPIANPGLASIEAALYPADTPYYYFVSRKDGTHAFSVTYQEHLRNQRQYR